MKLRTARVLDRSIVLVATLVLAANTYRYPSQQFWDDVFMNRRYLLLVLLIIVGVFGALTPIEILTARQRADWSVTIRQQVLSGFGRMVELRNGVSPPLPISDISLHIWQKRRTLRHPFRGVLARTATYRLGANPINRPFSPPIGVGVVGLCWKRNQEVSFDVEEIRNRLTDEASYSAFRDSNGGDSVMNLTWTDFERVRHRGAVFATPVRNGKTTFVGCLSVDASHGYNELNTDELVTQMSQLSVIIGAAGFENT